MAPAPALLGLCRRAFSQILFGRRGIIKTNALWLSLGAVSALERPRAGHPDPGDCLVTFAAATCISQGAILLNDVIDAAADSMSGKERWITRLPRPAAIALILVLFSAGFALVVAAGAPPATLATYALASALACSYSAPPFTAKTRGLCGPAVYALATAFAFALFPLSWFFPGWLPILTIGTAVFLDKWVNLLFHQILDRGADRASGVRTYATSTSEEHAARLLRWSSRVTAAWLTVVAVWILMRLPHGAPLVGATTGIAVIAAGTYASVARRRNVSQPLVSELSGVYLAVTYGFFRALPVMLFASVALADPPMRPLAILCASLIGLESWLFLHYRQP